MSSDLLFSVIPREGKLPVETDPRVKRVSKEARAKQLSDDEKDTHGEERLVSEQQQYVVHGKTGDNQKNDTPSDSANQDPAASQDEHSVDDSVYDSHGETEHPSRDGGDQPHIDTFT